MKAILKFGDLIGSLRQYMFIKGKMMSSSLKATLNGWHLWGLAVGLVISGDCNVGVYHFPVFACYIIFNFQHKFLAVDIFKLRVAIGK